MTAATRLTAVGWGQEKPLADNHSEEGRARNRRVEIGKKEAINRCINNQETTTGLEMAL